MPTSEAIKAKYAELCSPPTSLPAGWVQKRGYEFEDLLRELLEHEELSPRISFRPKGEQIDGSFIFGERVLLLEAKWHKDATPASTLYQFKGKVDGKLLGTIGIFISMSGYSDDAVDALIAGKSLNLILFDQQDIDAVILKDVSFRDILRNKLRSAAEEGSPYVPTEASVITGRSATANTNLMSLIVGTDVRAESVQTESDLTVVCEGGLDRIALSTLAARLLDSTNRRKTIKFVAALGKHSIPRVANALAASGKRGQQFLVVADGDGDPDGTLDTLTTHLDFENWTAAIPPTEIEEWLGIDKLSTRRLSNVERIQQAKAAAAHLDLNALATRDASFLKFCQAIVS